MDIDALIAKGRAAFDSVEPVDMPVTFGDARVTVRFWPQTGGEWRALTAVHPPRPGSVWDQNLGYNLDAVVRDYPKVYLVDGDDVVHVSVPSDPKKPNEWRWHGLYDVLPPGDMKNLASALWGLNEYEYQKRAIAAGKASAGGRRRKRS